MNIGIVCYPTYGGSGVIATELGKGLARRGHHVHFITYRQPTRLNSYQQNVYYHEVGIADYPLFEYTPYDTALTSKLVDVVKHEKLDILHVHYAIPHAAVAYMAKQILKTQGIEIPVVTTLHGTDITLVGNHPAFAPVVEFSINNSDGVTAVSRSLQQDTVSQFNVKNKIEVIHNFIDLSRFKKTNKDHFKKAIAPDGEKILSHVSNFRKVKRVQDVIQIFHQVLQQIPSKLLMIGDGPERRGLEALCRELKVCDHVRFLGKQDAIEELLAVSDLFIMPSESESFGLAALEAMACEVPVISSNTGGIPELNLHNKTGYLANVGDVDSMAKFAIKILQDDAMLKQFSEAAFEQAERFDIQRILPKYESYYESVMSANKVAV